MSLLPHIVSTRKLTSGRRVELQTKGWKFSDHNFVSKVIQIPVDLQQKSLFRHIVLTSITGVKAFIEITKQLQLNPDHYQVYCISPGTKDYAAACGLQIKSAAPNASLLADEIIKDVKVKQVTHIGSNRRRTELADNLIKASVALQPIIGYRTELTPMYMGMSYDAIVFFSPSAVDSFLMLNPLRPVPCFCMGKTTADHARQKGYHDTYTPEAPAEYMVLEIISDYYSKPSIYVKE